MKLTCTRSVRLDIFVELLVTKASNRMREAAILLYCTIDIGEGLIHTLSSKRIYQKGFRNFPCNAYPFTLTTNQFYSRITFIRVPSSPEYYSGFEYRIPKFEYCFLLCENFFIRGLFSTFDL